MYIVIHILIVVTRRQMSYILNKFTQQQDVYFTK